MATVDKSKLRVDIILGVAAAIEREPDLYNQFMCPELASCDSPSCIAGWAIYLDLGRDGYNSWLANHHETSIVMMSKAFGISLENAQTLFLTRSWPINYREAFLADRSSKARASIAASYLRSIVETGEV